MPLSISRAAITRCRVVYLGPPGAGKATSLRYVYANINPLRKGELRQRARGRDQILELSFDVRIRSAVARVSLATVTGPVSDPQVFVDLLEGVHGVVIVADSQPQAFGSNLRALQFVEQALGLLGRRLSAVPHVLQYNKRDLHDVLPIAELDDALNRYGVASFATVATEGREVEDALVALTASVIDTTESAERGGASAARATPASGPELSPLEQAERSQLRSRLQRQRRKDEIDKAVSMAEHFLAQDDMAECLRWARKALHHDPDHARARDLFERAKAKLDELVERLYADAIAARDAGDLAGAAERAEHALELHPHHRGFELLLAEIRKLTERPRLEAPRRTGPVTPVAAPPPAPAPPPPAPPPEDPATRHKEEVVALIRESEELLKQGDPRAALEVIARLEERASRLPGGSRDLLGALEQRRRVVYEGLRARARQRADVGDYERALEDLTLVLEHDPHNSETLALVDQVGTAIITRAGSGRGSG